MYAALRAGNMSSCGTLRMNHCTTSLLLCWVSSCTRGSWKQANFSPSMRHPLLAIALSSMFSTCAAIATRCSFVLAVHPFSVSHALSYDESHDDTPAGIEWDVFENFVYSQIHIHVWTQAWQVSRQMPVCCESMQASRCGAYMANKTSSPSSAAKRERPKQGILLASLAYMGGSHVQGFCSKGNVYYKPPEKAPSAGPQPNQ